LVRQRKGHYRELFEAMRSKGYLNMRIDGEHLAFVPREARPKKHRWGPPRNVETAEEQPTRRAGPRGAVRNSKPSSAAKKPAKPDPEKAEEKKPEDKEKKD
jgi:hypothetical protein